MPPECSTEGCTRAACAEAVSKDEVWAVWMPYCDPCQQRLFDVGYTVRKYVGAVA